MCPADLASSPTVSGGKQRDGWPTSSSVSAWIYRARGHVCAAAGPSRAVRESENLVRDPS